MAFGNLRMNGDSANPGRKRHLRLQRVIWLTFGPSTLTLALICSSLVQLLSGVPEWPSRLPKTEKNGMRMAALRGHGCNVGLAARMKA